ncbi:hypothetical protein F7725_021946 [Dissostichus mawsoni]|uniref:Uncharacterized protein n=1 Tax=Dissostichus mawsoni TaxID=36200 RepID=A0A7J5ZFY0_DISMA|nr:hypothetical protein F7725_021946 [Dissostichus mawsoni]
MEDGDLVQCSYRWEAEGRPNQSPTCFRTQHFSKNSTFFPRKVWDTNVMKEPLKLGTTTIQDSSFDFVLRTKK